MPALLVCPSCGHSAQIHHADPDVPRWGCYACHGCALGYEETGDLIAGRMRPEAEKLVGAIEDVTRDRIKAGEPLVVDDPRAAGAVLPALLLRMFVCKPGGATVDLPDRVFVMRDTAQVDQVERLFADACEMARKAVGG